MNTIHIDPEPLLAALDEHGWTQGNYMTLGGKVCAHGAVRLCQPVPGDAQLIEQVASRQGWGTGWNDNDSTTEADVRARLAKGIDITDEDLEATFGPQWQAVVNLVRRAAVLTPDETKALGAAGVAAWVAAWVAAGVAAGAAARVAAGAAARVAARNAAWVAAGVAAGAAARVAARAAVTWDLATPDGPYTIAQRDLLIGPWRDVIGLPEGLVEP